MGSDASHRTKGFRRSEKGRRILRKFVEASRWSRCFYDVGPPPGGIFGAGEAFKGETGLLDDIRDLRRYLILVEDFVLQTDNNKEEEEWDYSTGSEEEENDQ